MDRLPSGPHGIPADIVARNQRERLIAALAEVCGEKAYAEITITDIVRRAAVSSATFYKFFADKRACMLAAHEELCGRLLGEVELACAEREGEARVRSGIRTALQLLAADPPSARLLTVEVLALGAEGAARHAAMIEAFARQLRGSEEVGVEEWVLGAGIAALIGRLVIAGEAEALPALEDELVAFAIR